MEHLARARVIAAEAERSYAIIIIIGTSEGAADMALWIWDGRGEAG